MDGMNPFMGYDPQDYLRRFMPNAMGQGLPQTGVPGAMENQMAAGAQMPGAGNLAGVLGGGGQNPQAADRLQKLGKLLTSLGAFHQPPKPQAPMPQPQAQPQAPQMGTQGMGQVMQRLPMMPQIAPQMPRVGMTAGGMGAGRQQVPPADITNRLLASLSQYGG